MERRKAEGEDILRRLLAAQRVAFDKSLLSLLPTIHGLYAIADKATLPHEFLHAGKSRSGQAGLRGRV